MGAVFYHHIDPSSKGYAELRYWNQWALDIAKASVDAATTARGKNA